MAMASSMWSALEGGNPGGMGGMGGGASAAATTSTTDPATLLNNQLASALSTIGDAQYWEESISPTEIRQALERADPSNPTSTQALLRAMKWLLASISKGRDVSDFYSHVVKMVGCVSLEVRKMVYMYLVQYADHDATTRELSLLSINSFQRGMADAEPLIRALALRVLSSIHVNDILQIQILGVQKCSKDRSPYVRKCAAHALAKLRPRCCLHDAQAQCDMLIEIMQELLHTETSTMVLTSTLIAFSELCPEQLHRLHPALRKVCHLLADMDEWGQVVVIDLLARYCRRYFKEPVGLKEGTAERIDRERRVRRTIHGIGGSSSSSSSGDAVGGGGAAADNGNMMMSSMTPTLADQAARAGVALPPRTPPTTSQYKDDHHPTTSASTATKVKRRVVKKGFYSDEEDASTEEEVYADSLTGAATRSPSAALRQPSAGAALLVGTTGAAAMSSMGTGASMMNMTDTTESADLAPDHTLILDSAMPLLKSRNAGVVLAVCSLQYYCGVSSVKVRTDMGKALVRIHRDRSIQYVVLCSIRTLVKECPSAFMPFLHDFFIKTSIDPPFTRIIKLDILTSLALEPAAIEAVLNELRTYIRRSDDNGFARAAIRAVGRVAEMARIVFDRHAATATGRDAATARTESNAMVLNCLAGLTTLTRTCHSPVMVGEACKVMQQILQMLMSNSPAADGSRVKVQDPNHVQDAALRRILLLLVNTLSLRISTAADQDEDDDDSDAGDDDQNDAVKMRTNMSVVLTSSATASALWLVGECLVSRSDSDGVAGADPAFTAFGKLNKEERSKIRLELLRVVASAFHERLSPEEKMQGIHFASKVLVSTSSGAFAALGEGALCEHILSMARLDVNPEVRDRARTASSILRVTGCLKLDMDGFDAMPPGEYQPRLTLDEAKKIFLQTAPAPSSLPLEDTSTTRTEDAASGVFRFGTLSSLVGHPGAAYLPLPAWADSDSPSKLREPPPAETDSSVAQQQVTDTGGPTVRKQNQGFYDDAGSDDDSSSTSSSSSSSSSDDSSSSGSSSSSSSADSSGSSTSDSATSDNDDSSSDSDALPQQVMQQPQGIPHRASNTTPHVEDVSDQSSDDSSADKIELKAQQKPQQSLIPTTADSKPPESESTKKAEASVMDDFKGMVLAPVAVDASSADPSEGRTRTWQQMVRPEHAGGLSLDMVYLRGAAKVKQAAILGLAETPSLVCLHFRFSNDSDRAIRHIRILQRSSSASSASMIVPRKVAIPQEISILEQGKRADCMLGIDFAGTSDRDKSSVASLELRFGTSRIPLEIKPTLGDMLLPCTCTVAEFDDSIRKLQGFQRVVSKFSLPDPKTDVAALVGDAAALTPVGKRDESDGMIRMVGLLPASKDPVYIQVKCDPSGKIEITVCSDHALAVNSIMNLMKRSVQGTK